MLLLEFKEKTRYNLMTVVDEDLPAASGVIKLPSSLNLPIIINNIIN